ncbi:four-carbon acid sugar kinase family protein [Hwanghaeella sp.]|uniref:four-carbon acid sugar kinase family protein n=1 Tax=Hwanghaeella sp. TaxID=2605943 RepID=UPI003CCB7543
MGTKFGIVSDDFTGGLLVASYLEEAGIECPVYFDPNAAIEDNCTAPAIVIAGRTRLTPVAEALTETSRALDALDRLGCPSVGYKACASFDATEDGNIGPVADLLADRYGDLPILMSAGFPEFRCTVHFGHLFYRGTLVNESAKKLDPITPMQDPNLVRFLSRQTRTPLGLLTHLDMIDGLDPARRTLQALTAEGYRHVLLDCSDMQDITVSTDLALNRRAIVASDPLIISLALAHTAGQGGTAPAPVHSSGPAAVLAGSVGPVAEAQIEAFRAIHPVLTIDLLSDKAEEQQISAALDWSAKQDGHPLAVTTFADEAGVKAVQAKLGMMEAARKAERILAGIAKGLHAQGVRRFIVSGGETSGSVVSALEIKNVRSFARGPNGGGYCVTAGPDPVSLFLKSGKLGGTDAFLTALDDMKP